MCLHRGVHGQESALEKSAECGGSHLSYLIHQSQGVETFRLKVRSAPRLASMIPRGAFECIQL